MVKIRKMVTVVEEILSDGGREAKRAVRKAAAVVVLENPFAGRFVEDLTPLIDAGEELGALLRAVRTMLGDLDTKTMLERIVEEAAAIAGTPHVSLRLADRDAPPLGDGDLALPVKIRDTVLGVLAFHTTTPRTRSTDQRARSPPSATFR